MSKLPKKDLLGIKNLSATEILTLLEMAKAEKPKIKNPQLRDDSLKNVSLATLFYENSTRTKLSFLLAGDYLGAITNDLNISTSSVAKGETLIDTGLTLDSMGINIIVIRHSMAGSAQLLAENVSAAVVNGGDGSNEHPTQALLDLFTMWEHKNSFANLKVAILGDIANSRVARSNIFGLTKLGANVTLAGPPTLVSQNMASLGVTVTNNITEAIADADFIMGLRVQLERQKAATFPSLAEYAHFWGLTKEHLQHAKPDAIIMHPGPVNRGVELSTELIDGDRSVIYPQVENGVAIRMAVLKYLALANIGNIGAKKDYVIKFL
ncbi:MAG: aspartate carbamoyltransferase catalytic subunit [Defluviitaleaceae bacterium]|nr:aspartate carbamoyltransferase catalytic subunit [Defluviitaleaceae bacterium]